MSKIMVIAEGLISSKNGAKTARLANGMMTIHYGWFMQVRDEKGNFETSFPVKTTDEALSLQLAAAAANGTPIIVTGHLRNEAYGRDENGKAKNWVQNLYATNVEEAR